jgi:hypothetical protein
MYKDREEFVLQKSFKMTEISNSGAMNDCQNGNGHCCKVSKDHCVNGNIFLSAKQMYVHTGNVTNWSRSNSKVVKSTTEEVRSLL